MKNDNGTSEHSPVDKAQQPENPVKHITLVFEYKTDEELQKIREAAMQDNCRAWSMDHEMHRVEALEQDRDKLLAAMKGLMNCADSIMLADRVHLEDALTCGDKDTEAQAAAWITALDLIAKIEGSEG